MRGGFPFSVDCEVSSTPGPVTFRTRRASAFIGSALSRASELAAGLPSWEDHAHANETSAMRSPAARSPAWTGSSANLLDRFCRTTQLHERVSDGYQASTLGSSLRQNLTRIPEAHGFYFVRSPIQRRFSRGGRAPDRTS